MSKDYHQLPKDWDTLRKEEKSIWFARHCINYTREGEYDGIREEVSEEVKTAYELFCKENS